MFSSSRPLENLIMPQIAAGVPRSGRVARGVRRAFNLDTATIGLEIAPTLLTRANEVIE